MRVHNDHEYLQQQIKQCVITLQHDRLRLYCESCSRSYTHLVKILTVSAESRQHYVSDTIFPALSNHRFIGFLRLKGTLSGSLAQRSL